MSPVKVRPSMKCAATHSATALNPQCNSRLRIEAPVR